MPLLLSRRSLYLPTQSQTSFNSASLGLSARRPSYCSDNTNEEANVRANIDVATGHGEAVELHFARLCCERIVSFLQQRFR